MGGIKNSAGKGVGNKSEGAFRPLSSLLYQRFLNLPELTFYRPLVIAAFFAALTAFGWRFLSGRRWLLLAVHGLAYLLHRLVELLVSFLDGFNVRAL